MHVAAQFIAPESAQGAINRLAQFIAPPHFSLAVAV